MLGEYSKAYQEAPTTFSELVHVFALYLGDKGGVKVFSVGIVDMIFQGMESINKSLYTHMHSCNPSVHVLAVL